MSVLNFSNASDLGRSSSGKSSGSSHKSHHQYSNMSTGAMGSSYDQSQDEDRHDYSAEYETVPEVDAKKAWEEAEVPTEPYPVLKQKYPLRPVSEFIYDPKIDPTAILSVDGVRELNPKVFDENSKAKRIAQWEDSFDPRCMFRFALKCPLKQHRYSDIRYCEITFSLKTNGMTLPEFAAAMQNNVGYGKAAGMRLEMECSKTQLKAAFGCGDALQLEQGHIIPKHIYISSEHGNLPIDMKMCLMSNQLASAEARNKRKKKVEWSRVTGTHNTNTSDCGVCHIVPQQVCRMGKDQEKSLYIAHSDQNSWMFPQYINTSKDHVMEELHKAKKSNDPDFIEIRAGAPDMIVADSLLQYLAVTNNAELIKLSHKHEDTQPRIGLNAQQQKVHIISLKAMTELIDNIFDKIDREKMCMNLNGLSVVLSPLRGATQGKLDLNTKVQALQKLGAMSDKWFPHYMVTLCIAYAPCDHEPDTDMPRNLHTSASAGLHGNQYKSSGKSSRVADMGFSAPSAAYPMPSSFDDPLMPGQ